MTLPQLYDLEIEEGATLKRWWRLRHSDGTVANLDSTYNSGSLVIKDQFGGTEIVTLDTDNGGLVIEYQADAAGANWSGYLYMSAAATDALTDWGEGVLIMKIDDGADVIRVLQGVATLSSED